MTLLEVEELTRYWAEHPPVHIMVAAYLGVKPKESAAAVTSIKATTPDGREDLVSSVLAELGPMSGFVERDVHEGMPAPILDFAELSARARERAIENTRTSPASR